MFLSVAIHLIKFLKTKGEEIEGISIVEKTEKKTEVRRIGENPNECCKANEHKIQTEQLQETNLKKTERLPQCYFIEGKTGGVVDNVMGNMLKPNNQENKIVEEIRVNENKRKLHEDRRRRLREDERFRMKNVRTEKPEIVLQKERSEETKVLNFKTLEDKSMKTKANQREIFNIQKVYLNNINNTEKRTERDKALYNILDIKKDQTTEKVKLNEKEKENFKDNNNTIIKAPGLKEKDQCERKRKCYENDQDIGKKRKTDAEENRNKNEEKCDVEEEYDDKCKVGDRSKSLMVSMTCA